MLKKFLAAVLALAPMVASAQVYEDRLLYSRGAWTVKLVHNTSNGSLMCMAETWNRDQSFSIAAHQYDVPTIYISDPSWNLRPRNVTIQVDVDYTPWTLYTEASGNGLFAYMDDGRAGGRFVRDLQRSTAVAIKDMDGNRQAVFSLAGSSAALDAWFACWNQIDPVNYSDPF